MARPSRFHPHMVGKLEKLLLLGFTNEQLIAELGLNSTVTLHNWRKKYPKVNEVFERCRSLAQGAVAASLYKRANGFRVKTEKIFHHPDTGIVRAKTSEYYPPDVRAAELILRSRRPQEWPSPNSVNVGVQVVAGIPPETLEGLQKLARITAGFDVPQAQNTPTIESHPPNQTRSNGTQERFPSPVIDTTTCSEPDHITDVKSSEQSQPIDTQD